MGTWNHKPFGNDSACDWLWTLEKAHDTGILVQSLKRGLGNTRRTASEEENMVAIAAAAVVAATCCEPIGNLPKEAKQWVLGHGASPTLELQKLALRVVQQIILKSALRDLWEESKKLNKWLTGMKPLLNVLAKPAKKKRPTRTPAPVTARLSLPKLIRKVVPTLEGPTRATLTRKLAALKNVNGFLSGEWQQTPLHLLTRQGLLPEMIALIERGAIVDPDTPRDKTVATPLELACSHGHAQAAEFLIGKGARLTRELRLLNGKQFIYSFALSYAVGSGSEQVVDVLLKHGLDIHTTDPNGRSLLFRATEAGHASMVRFLVKKGLDPNLRDERKWTPLHLATMSNKSECVRELLAQGAKVNAKDEQGASALDFATGRTHQKIAHILRKNGGCKTRLKKGFGLDV